MRMSRRQVLTGLSGIALGLPWLEKLHGTRTVRAQSAPRGPKRIISVAYEMGVPLGAFRPSATGSVFTLPYVTAPLERFQDRCLFVSGIDNVVLEAGGSSFVFGHPAKKEAALTGTLTTGAFPTSNTNMLAEIRGDASTEGAANGPSVDHVIGAFLRNGQGRPSIDLGVDGDAVWRPVSETANSNFFFEGSGNPCTLALHPHRALDSLFAGIGGDGPSEADAALRNLRARNKSVLDAVRASFHELKQGLGREDRQRLEEHAARIRQLEIDVQVGAGCSVPVGISDGNDYRGFRMDQLAPSMIRILAHAMGCDLAPVGRLEIMNQQSPRFGIASLDGLLDANSDGYDWHALVHGDPLPGTSTALRPGRDGATAYHPELLNGYRFFVQQFANLLDALDAIPEGPETTVLDNSLVVLATDLGEGLGHGHAKMAYVLAGNVGSARRGFHFDGGPARAFEVSGEYFYAASRHNVSQLLNSMLDMAGVTGPAGEPARIGLGGFLESRGLARRIDGLFA